VTDGSVARTYQDYWEELSSDPTLSNAIKAAVRLTPNPPNAPSADEPTAFFSPRVAENMLDWYAQRLDNCASLSMMTIPFNVAPTILKGLSSAQKSLRLVILEDPPTSEVLAAEKASKGQLAFSNGAILGKSFVKSKSSFGGAKATKIQSPLDKWFLDEELARPINKGHVFFVHSKVMLIDPLSDDPLVCCGSANFSKNSLIANDENMLVIRGGKRVADIYMTEFDRIFRHFYARDAINSFAKKGSNTNPLELDDSPDWMTPYFAPGHFKNNRRLMFFPSTPVSSDWAEVADKDNDPFADEAERAKTNRAKKKPKASQAQDNE
jgi:phosphatidylserine/phosphatidylglycerophosphate/cardiolipin synthase-like enzyme